jgi:hypothetical protein
MWFCIVAYSLKARFVEPQQPAVTRQRPVNKKEMIFSAQSVPMAAHATIEYVMASLSSNSTATEERCFLCDPCRYVISRWAPVRPTTPRVEAGSNTSTVTLRVVGGDEKGSLKYETSPTGLGPENDCAGEGQLQL